MCKILNISRQGIPTISVNRESDDRQQFEVIVSDLMSVRVGHIWHVVYLFRQENLANKWYSLGSFSIKFSCF